MQGSSDSKTIASFNSLLSEASSFAPCVLLLRDLPALVGVAAGSNQQPVATLKIAEAVAASISRHCSATARQAVVPWKPAGGKVLGGRGNGDVLGGDNSNATHQPGSNHVAVDTNLADKADVAAPESDLGYTSHGLEEQRSAAAESLGLVVIVGSTSNREDVPVALGRCFTHEIGFDAPDRDGYASLLTGMLSPCMSSLASGPDSCATDITSSQTQQQSGDTSFPMGTATGVNLGESLVSVGVAALQNAASQMVGLLPRDVQGVVADALVAAAGEDLNFDEYLAGDSSGGIEMHPPSSIAEGADDVASLATASATAASVQHNHTPSLSECHPAAIHHGNTTSTSYLLPTLKPDHLQTALGRVKARTAVEIGAPQVPNVAWDDVGGLEDVKRAILDTVELPLKHRSAFVCGRSNCSEPCVTGT